MAILNFQRPDEVVMLNSDDYKGSFEFKPVEPGYGITVGNAIRRILLSSLTGFAITNIKISGVEHEFSAIDGVLEDVTEIILNLKQVRFKQQIEDIDKERVVINLKGKDKFVAGDIGKNTSAFQVLNSDFVICNMDNSVELNIELEINKGRGYTPSEDNKIISSELGLISIDSIFTPIRNVKYRIEDYRVEQKTDYEKLCIDIETDGTVHPKEALKEAAKILIHHFMLFSDERITLDDMDKKEEGEFDETSLYMRQLLKSKLIDLDISIRALNCLKAAEIDTLGELVRFDRTDLLKFRNFGKKSLTELEELVNIKGLHFGMDISKYEIDKD